MGVIGFGRVECGSSAQHFLLLRLFSFHSSGKLIFMHGLTLHWDSLTWRLSPSAYYKNSLFYPTQYISPYTIWPLNLPWNISRARCWKNIVFPLAVICAATAAFLLTAHKRFTVGCSTMNSRCRTAHWKRSFKLLFRCKRCPITFHLRIRRLL